MSPRDAQVVTRWAQSLVARARPAAGLEWPRPLPPGKGRRARPATSPRGPGMPAWARWREAGPNMLQHGVRERVPPERDSAGPGHVDRAGRDHAGGRGRAAAQYGLRLL